MLKKEGGRLKKWSLNVEENMKKDRNKRKKDTVIAKVLFKAFVIVSLKRTDTNFRSRPNYVNVDFGSDIHRSK
jgi:hypothetical protein